MAAVGSVPASSFRRVAGVARRALLRWALRLFRREWRQQLMVLCLLTVAVAATIVGIAFAVAGTAGQGAEFGNARQILELGRPTPDRLQADVAAARDAFGDAQPIAHASFVAAGLVEPLDVRDQDPAGRLGAPLLRLRRGRYPSGPSEAALTGDAATVLGVEIGASLEVGGRVRTVVGIVENPRKLSESFVLVAPGTIDAADHVDLLVHASDDALREFRFAGGSGGLAIKGYAPVRAAEAAGAVLAIGCVGMLFVGLLSVAGFATLAQRRRRALGMLAALGATDRQIRQTLVASGAVTGLAGAAAGTAVGLAAWFVLAGRLEGPLDHRLDRFDLPWWAIAATAGLAVLTAAGAAWWPARAASKVPVVAALADRPPRSAPVHRSASAGAVLVGAGAGLLAVSDQRTPWAIVGGSIGVVVGVLLLAPLAVRSLGVVAGHLPVAGRLALRDLVRNRARSGAAVGAVALALGIAATVSISAAVRAADDRSSAVRGNLPDDEMMIYAGRPGAGPVPVLDDVELASARAAVARIAEALGGSGAGAAASVELRAAHDADAPTASIEGVTGVPPVALVEPERQDGKAVGFAWASALYVADAAVLEHLGVRASEVPTTADVVTPRRDLASTELIAVQLSPDAKDREVVEVQPVFAHLDLPAYSSRPSTLLTTAAVDRLGLVTLPVAWSVRADAPLTTEQIASARGIAASVGLAIETREPGPRYGRVRLYATASGMLVALAVLAMSVGLLRAESARDVRTLAATGASARTRRAIVAFTAAALGLLGGVLAVTGVYLALLAWHHERLAPLGAVPVADLAAIVVGLPLAATVGGWLLAGRDPSGLGRRASE